MKPQIRIADVALTAPALAHQWARQENGPHGAAVVAHREISARSRGGVEWTEPHAIAVSVIARPDNMAVSGSELGWLAVGLAAADTLDWMEGQANDPRLRWPDGVDPIPAAGAVAVAVLSEAILGPGRVAYLIATVRIGLTNPIDDARRRSLTTRAVEALRQWTDALDDPDLLVDNYRRRCTTLGHRFTVHRSPHGSVRGTAHDISPEGALILRSPTGLDEVITVSTAKRLEPFDPPGDVTGTSDPS